MSIAHRGDIAGLDIPGTNKTVKTNEEMRTTDCSLTAKLLDLSLCGLASISIKSAVLIRDEPFCGAIDMRLPELSS
jgi:hypothetical protein